MLSFAGHYRRISGTQGHHRDDDQQDPIRDQGPARSPPKTRPPWAAAEENVEAITKQKQELEAAFQKELSGLEATVDPSKEEFDEVIIRPKKTNITIRVLALAWVPHWKDATGKIASAWE